MLVLARVQHQHRLLEALAQFAVLHPLLMRQPRDLGRQLPRGHRGRRAGDEAGRDHERAPGQPTRHSHTAPLCGARLTKGTPKNVRKAMTKTATINSAP